MDEFEKELTHLINRHSIENEVDMPDFMLARMLCATIESMGASIKKTRNEVKIKLLQTGKEKMKYTKDFEKWLSRVAWPEAMFRENWRDGQIKRFAWSAWQSSRRHIRKPTARRSKENDAPQGEDDE